MNEFDPQDVKKQESATPNIIRFLRKASQVGTQEHTELSKYTTDYRRLVQLVLDVVSGNVPPGMFPMIVNELSDEKFKQGLSVLVITSATDVEIRTYIENWFSKKDINFKFISN